MLAAPGNRKSAPNTGHYALRRRRRQPVPYLSAVLDWSSLANGLPREQASRHTRTPAIKILGNTARETGVTGMYLGRASPPLLSYACRVESMVARRERWFQRLGLTL